MAENLNENLNYGDMLNILLHLLFPHQPTPTYNSHVRKICSYNPRAERIARRLFQLLRKWGADPNFLRELEKQFKESVMRDKLDGCIPIYKNNT